MAALLYLSEVSTVVGRLLLYLSEVSTVVGRLLLYLSGVSTVVGRLLLYLSGVSTIIGCAVQKRGGTRVIRSAPSVFLLKPQLFWGAALIIPSFHR